MTMEWGCVSQGTPEKQNQYEPCLQRFLIEMCSHDSVQLSYSVVSDSATPGIVARQTSLFAQTHVHQVGDAIQPSHLLSSPSPLPSIFPSIRVSSNESVLHIRWPKYWSFSISLSNEYSGLISFRMDWYNLLAVQGTLKSLLQHHSSKASILQHSALFMV